MDGTSKNTGTKVETNPQPAAAQPTPKSPQQTSPIHLLTVGRRAKLAGHLEQKKEEALAKLSTAKALDAAVRQTDFGKSEIGFYEEVVLMGIWGILDSFLTDTAIEFLVCFPGGLQTKQFPLEAIAKSGAISTLLREAAEKEINELAYKTFPEMLKRLQEVFNFKKALDENLVNDLNEFKCTRDVYVHGKGQVNRLYLRKAGNSAREQRVGSTLLLGKDYLTAMIAKAENLINDFYAGGPMNYLSFGQVRAFREMWEACCLNRIMPFDAAWEPHPSLMAGVSPIVRPSNKALEWGWSHSEKALFDFFLAIFRSRHEVRSTDTMDAMARFSPGTPEGQIIISWMDSPFWF